MNKQSSREAATSSAPKAPRKTSRNDTLSKDMCQKKKVSPDERMTKNKVASHKTGKNSVTRKRNPNKSCNTLSPIHEYLNNPKNEYIPKCTDKNSIFYYLDELNEADKADGIDNYTHANGNSPDKQIEQIEYDEDENNYITYYDNGEFEYGYPYEDNNSERPDVKHERNRKILSRDTEYKKNYISKPSIDCPTPSLRAFLRGFIVLIFLSYAAMDYFLIEPYEQKRKELWAPRKHKSHFNIDPNRSPKEISDMDYVNRTVTYIAPMPKDTILPPSPVPKLSKEDYLEEPLNLYEDYYETFYDYYHD